MVTRKITSTLMSLIFLSGVSISSAFCAPDSSLRSTKPAISSTKPQLKGKITQDACDLKTQQPKVDSTPPLTGKIKRHALWDAYEIVLSKTDDLGRVPKCFLHIQTIFEVLKNPKVDDNTKRFLSFLVKNWGTFTTNEDPPPLNLEVLGECIWAVAEQSIPLNGREDSSGTPTKITYFVVDADHDNMLTREELETAIRTLDAVPIAQKRKEGHFNYFRMRATLSLLLESFDMFDAQTNKEAYKYL
ncbi:MAG: hypothetical protein K2Y22_05925 [Candidatus Obscuribacterales bacterium]|nr:hypothetical protein [Candidatus Obscuribacterales bacterium]